MKCTIINTVNRVKLHIIQVLFQGKVDIALDKISFACTLIRLCYLWLWKLRRSVFDLSVPLVGLIHEQNIHKMRILTTLTLAIQQNEISFATMTELLGLKDDDEIEEFVIDCKDKSILLKNRSMLLIVFWRRSFYRIAKLLGCLLLPVTWWSRCISDICWDTLIFLKCFWVDIEILFILFFSG